MLVSREGVGLQTELEDQSWASSVWICCVVSLDNLCFSLSWPWEAQEGLLSAGHSKAWPASEVLST